MLFRCRTSHVSARAKDDEMNECDALESISTLAHELKIKNVPQTTEGSGGVADVIAA